MCPSIFTYPVARQQPRLYCTVYFSSRRKFAEQEALSGKALLVLWGEFSRDLASCSQRTELAKALFDEIVKMALTPHPPGADGSYDPDLPVAEQLAKLIDGYVAIVSEEQYIALVRVVTVEFIQQPELAGALQESAPEDRFVHFLGTAMKAGALRSVDPGHAAAQLSALLKAFVFWPGFFQAVPPPGDDERVSLCDDCIAMFLKHYQIE